MALMVIIVITNVMEFPRNYKKFYQFYYIKKVLHSSIRVIECSFIAFFTFFLWFGWNGHKLFNNFSRFFLFYRFWLYRFRFIFFIFLFVFFFVIIFPIKFNNYSLILLLHFSILFWLNLFRLFNFLHWLFVLFDINILQHKLLL